MHRRLVEESGDRWKVWVDLNENIYFIEKLLFNSGFTPEFASRSIETFVSFILPRISYEYAHTYLLIYAIDWYLYVDID